MVGVMLHDKGIFFMVRVLFYDDSVVSVGAAPW